MQSAKIGCSLDFDLPNLIALLPFSLHDFITVTTPTMEEEL